MIRFIDGPAAGQVLTLKRLPLMLRVVQDSLTGKWDALDQLADVPNPSERIYVYRSWGEPSVAFVDYRGKGGRREGCRVLMGVYRFWPEQPTEEVLRSNPDWQAWCEANREAIDRGFTS